MSREQPITIANQMLSTLFASRWAMNLWIILAGGVRQNAQKSADANTVGIAFLQVSYWPILQEF